MKQQYLNGCWKARWSDGLRGGMPHFIKEDGNAFDADLLGTPRSVSNDYDESRWLNAQVPGEIHLDLMNAGLIEDVNVSINALSCRWVEEAFWYYRTTFEGADAAKARYASITFEGLEYSAIVYLNGCEIGRHENAFCPLVIDISGRVLAGENVLVVSLESGIYKTAEKSVSNLYTACRSVDYLLHKRMYMRKSQSSCGWDWSPRLQNIGIFKDVTLSYDETAVVESVSIRNQTAEDLKSATLEARVFLTNFDAGRNDYQLCLNIDGQNYFTNAQAISNNCISLEVTLENPRIWQPIGYGSQELYQVSVTLLQGEKEIYQTTKQTGFRHVMVDQSPHPETGNYFNIVVNGNKIFAKGGNFVPMDMITAALTRDRYDSITDLALECNSNFLRVWGGGLYESDDFYELCDQKGILVWQEFIAACATLPYNDEDFQQNIQNEAIYNLRRLSRYPSLIVWCGNNEMDIRDIHNFFGQIPEDAPWYHEVLPQLVKREDPEKYYQPCSPWSFDGSSSGSDTVGDQHPWSIGFRDKDHRKYRELVCRFPNEGGVLGPVSLKTIHQCLINDNEKKFHSFAWDFHDNMLESYQCDTSNDYTVSFWTKKNAADLSLEQLVYLSGFLQGEGLTEYINSFRSKKFTCGSAIFWMFNDCWPCTRSWTVVDYYHRRTPSFYAVKRCFSPVAVSICQIGDAIQVVGMNDTTKDFHGSLVFGAMQCDGKVLFSDRLSVTISAELSHPVYTATPEQTAQIDGCRTIAFAVLYNENQNQVSSSRLIHATYDELKLEDAPVTVHMEGTTAVFESSKPVFGVCLDLDGDTPLTDNLFDLFPSIPYRIEWNSDKAPTVLYTLNQLMAQ